MESKELRTVPVKILKTLVFWFLRSEDSCYANSIHQYSNKQRWTWRHVQELPFGEDITKRRSLSGVVYLPSSAHPTTIS